MTKPSQVVRCFQIQHQLQNNGSVLCVLVRLTEEPLNFHHSFKSFLSL